MATACRELLECPDLVGGRIGVLVVDAADGTELASAMADCGFAPASNQKLLTAATVLQTVGSRHRFSTELWARGEVHDGVLHGELVLVGKGDPTFAAADRAAATWAELAAALRAAGIAAVRGRVVGDGSWLGDETLGVGWQWDYLDADYAAPFSGLCAAGNQMTIRVRPGPTGPSVEVDPPGSPQPDVRLDQVEAGAASAVVIRRPLGAEVPTVVGRIAADAGPITARVAVADPAAFAAAVAAAGLRAAGLSIEADGAAPPLTAPRQVAVVPSPPAAALLATMLTDSDNLLAEVLLRAAVRVVDGDGSSAAIERRVAATLAGFEIDARGLVVADGSGLSRRNLVQPRQLVQLLLAMWRSPEAEVFTGCLPLAGATGTLRRRFAGGPAAGRVAAKTGTIARVVALSGYVARPDPAASPLVFSVLVNDFVGPADRARAAVDRFVEQLAVAAGWPAAASAGPPGGAGQKVTERPNWKPSMRRSAS